MEEIKHVKEQTPKGTELNIDSLYKLCPQCFTEAKNKEGKVRLAVDFDKLRQLLGDITISHTDEHYEFNWVGKRDAFCEASEPTTSTLRPCPEESKDWEHTKNLYIEGNNLEVLKLLLKSYAGKVKMIYIDPPYNTGKDFMYHDNFHRTKAEESAASGDVDEQGNKYRVNTESNGEFHSDWCSMMYARLLTARHCISEDGVIFISIDDNEVENLRKICDEVFGEKNFVECLKWKRKKQPSFLAKHTAKLMEYVLVYALNRELLAKLSIESISDSTKKVINLTNKPSERVFKAGFRVKSINNGIVPKGKYKIKTMEVEYLDDIHVDNGRATNKVRVKSKFTVTQANIEKFIDEDLLFVTANNGLRRDVSKEETNKRKSITDLLLDWGDNQDSEREMKNLFGTSYFEYTKPTKLIYNLSKSVEGDDFVVIDFFSGSATTAHAVMQLNAEDGGNRKFIMVQIPEKTPENSDAYNAGYKTICEIGKERIRRAGKKIKEDSPLTTQDLDIGFRVLKLDSSNMKDVYFHPKEVKQDSLEMFNSNIKDDRHPLDLLFDCMLRWGLTLDMPISTEKVESCNLQIVNGGDLIGVFDGEVTDDVVHAIAKKNPLRVVFRDDCFTDSNVKLNVYETFKQECGWRDEEAKNNIRVI